MGGEALLKSVIQGEIKSGENMPGPDALKEKPGQLPQGAKLVKRLVNSLQSVSSFSEEMQARCMVPCTEV